MTSNSHSATLANSLSSRADELTSRHSREGTTALPPPLVAAQSPLHELLIDEIEGVLPKPVAQRLREAKTIAQVHDWIAAAAMYKWIKANESASRRFLDEVGQHPSDACLSLAKSIARTLKPQPPTDDAPRLDRWGLLIQVSCALLLLMMRGAFFEFLTGLAEKSAWRFDFSGMVHSSVLPNLIFQCGSVSPLVTVLLMGCGTSWLFLESRFVPRVVTACRAWPFRHQATPSHQDWRSDGVAFVWCMHGFLLQAGLLIRCLRLAFDQRLVLCQTPILVAGIWVCTAIVAAVTIAVLLQLLIVTEQRD